MDGAGRGKWQRPGGGKASVAVKLRRPALAAGRRQLRPLAMVAALAVASTPVNVRHLKKKKRHSP